MGQHSSQILHVSTNMFLWLGMSFDIDNLIQYQRNIFDIDVSLMY
jgi:hypothetical protein